MKLKFTNNTNPDKSNFIGFISDNGHSQDVDKWHDLSSVVNWYMIAHDGDDIDVYLDNILVGVNAAGELIQAPKED